jgi:DNA-binding transcriptional ArsR family regulator
MDALSATFAALADPTRRSILAQLAKGEATVNELAAPYAMSLPSVSRHLKVLEKAGLVSKGRSAQWRPCRLEVEPLHDVDAWMAPYRVFFESRFDRLDEQLKNMVAEREDRSTYLVASTEPPEPGHQAVSLAAPAAPMSATRPTRRTVRNPKAAERRPHSKER